MRNCTVYYTNLLKDKPYSKVVTDHGYSHIISNDCISLTFGLLDLLGETLEDLNAFTWPQHSFSSYLNVNVNVEYIFKRLVCHIRVSKVAWFPSALISQMFMCDGNHWTFVLFGSVCFFIESKNLRKPYLFTYIYIFLFYKALHKK